MTSRCCSVANCLVNHKAKGFCDRHYQRYRKYGDPLAGGTNYATPEEAFAARTEWQGECLVWIGSVCKKGYGQLRVSNRTVKAHRWAYEQVHGPVPARRMIDHKCRNRACVNADHLRLATNKQNMENRKANKGTIAGHRGVRWIRHMNKWQSYVYHNKVQHSGGYSPPYELHVASYRARELRNKHYTFNDIDKELRDD